MLLAASAAVCVAACAPAAPLVEPAVPSSPAAVLGKRSDPRAPTDPAPGRALAGVARDAAPSDGPGGDAPGGPDPDEAAEEFGILFRDDFSDAGSGWAIGTSGDVRVAYGDGELRVHVYRPGLLANSTRPVRGRGPDPALRVLHVEARAEHLGPAAGGAYGVMCAVDEQNYYALVIAPSGGHAIVRVVEGRGVVLVSDRRPHPAVSPTGANLIGADCIARPQGMTRLALYVNGEALASAEDDRFSAFSRVGLYAEALPEGRWFSAAFDDVVVRSARAGDAPVAPPRSGDAFPNELERVLLEHVPWPLRRTCARVRAPAADALAELRCGPAAGADSVTYARYPTPEAMYGRYDAIVRSLGGTRDRGDCARNWPAEGRYAVDGRQVGRVACARSDGSTAVIGWTDDRLNIVATAVRRDGRHRELHAFWATRAGPIE